MKKIIFIFSFLLVSNLSFSQSNSPIEDPELIKAKEALVKDRLNFEDKVVPIIIEFIRIAGKAKVGYRIVLRSPYKENKPNAPVKYKDIDVVVENLLFTDETRTTMIEIILSKIQFGTVRSQIHAVIDLETESKPKNQPKWNILERLDLQYVNERIYYTAQHYVF